MEAWWIETVPIAVMGLIFICTKMHICIAQCFQLGRLNPPRRAFCSKRLRKSALLVGLFEPWAQLFSFIDAHGCLPAQTRLNACLFARQGGRLLGYLSYELETLDVNILHMYNSNVFFPVMLLLCFGLRLRAERGLALIERLCKSGVKAAHYDPCILSRRLKLNIYQIKWQFSIQIYFRSESSSFKTFPFRPSMPMPPPHLRISYFWFTQNGCSSFGLNVSETII